LRCETKFQKAWNVGRQFTANKLSAESGVTVEESTGNFTILNINDGFIRSAFALIVGAALGGTLVYYICIIDFQKRAKLEADLQRENFDQKILKYRQGMRWKYLPYKEDFWPNFGGKLRNLA